MKPDKKTIMAIVLGIVALGVVIYQFGGAIPTGTTSVSAVPDASAVSTVARSSQSLAAQASSRSLASESDYGTYIATITEKDLAYRRSTFRDPMTALVGDAKEDEVRLGGRAAKVALGPTDALSMGYTVEGIVWNEVEPMAIVNNQVVSVGEQLDDGALIIEISKDTVKFAKDGNSYYLVFREE